MKTGFKPVFIRECKRIANSKVYIWGVFVSNIIALALLVYLMYAGVPTKLPVAVVDLDNTNTTRALIQKLDALQRSEVKYNLGSFQDATALMDKNEVYAIYVIPHNFTADMLRGQKPKLSYYSNMAYKVASSLMSQDLQTIGVLASSVVEQQMAAQKGYDATRIATIVSPINIETHPLQNPYSNYGILLLGMLNVVTLQLACILFTISGFGSEIKSNTAKDLIELSGNSTWKMMLGKLLPNTFVYIIIALLQISVLNYYMGYPISSGFLIVFVAYVCLILAAQGFGIILFGVFSNYRMALSAGSLLGMLSYSLVGFSFPTTQMNPILNALSHLFPAKIFYYIFGNNVLNGYPLYYSLKYFIVLLLFVFVGVIVSLRVRKILQFDTYEP